MTKSRDFAREYATYQGKPDQIKKRAMRNAARRKMEKAGRVHKGDGKDVDHRKPISKGGNNKGGNLRAVPKSKNRSFKRNSDHSMK
jgi:hypothetical protein